MNDVAAKQGGKAVSQVPISQHPAFPAIVALWFAALLGLGSLVLPASLFEAAVGASGIASVVPGAEPPLGVSARILIALVGAALGVVAGLLIARRVAAAQSQPGRASHRSLRTASDAAKRPISAHEELWSEGFDDPVDETPAPPIAGRRRALAVTDESGLSDLLHNAPLPGAETAIVFEEAALAPESIEAPISDASDDDALELAAFAEADAAVGEEPVALEQLAEPSISLDAARPFDAPLDPPCIGATISPEPQLREIEAEAPVFAETGPAPESESAAAPSRAEDGAQAFALGELSISELVERFALSLQHAAERAAEDARAQAAVEAPADTELPPRYVPDLGVEAVEAPRFAPPPEPAAGRESAEEPIAEPAPEPIAEPAPYVPAALRPVAFGEDIADEDESEELALTLSLAQDVRPFDRPSVSPAPAFVPAVAATSDDAEEPGEAGDGVADHGYSSLLDMRKQAANREFVRIEDEALAGDASADEAIEPVVVFPGQEQRRAAGPDSGVPQTPGAERPFVPPASVLGVASDPMQTERALREALHKLQRLSGAA